jgi:hypothetical protein
MKCPTCESPAPKLHPATQYQGEVTAICPDPFHTEKEDVNMAKFSGIPGNMTDPINDAWKERMRAHIKHGDNSIESTPGNSLKWLAILGEEIGEVTEDHMVIALAQAFGRVSRMMTYDQDIINLRKELIQVIGVAWAWANAVDNQAQEITQAKIDIHHDRMHGICVHGELRGECTEGGY